jgi:hypothetical protein
VEYLKRVANSEQPVQMLFMGSSLLKPRGRGYLGWTWNMPVSLDGFDPVAAVVDWLDACRARNLDALLDLYADDATLECKCEGKILKGLAEVADYWRPKLAVFSPTAFGLDEVSVENGDVALDYRSYEGKPVRIIFRFNHTGKIRQSLCAPSDQMPPQQRDH